MYRYWKHNQSATYYQYPAKKKPDESFIRVSYEEVISMFTRLFTVELLTGKIKRPYQR